jgi:Tol biopolymer transport system component
VPVAWFPKGDRLLIAARASGTSYTLATVDRSTRTLEPFGTDTFIELPHASLSPDGQWVAYDDVSSPSASGTIFVRPVPPTAKYRVDAGINPFWAPDGRTLYYVAAAGDPFLSAVTVTTTPSVEISKLAETVPRTQPAGGGPNLPRQYDVSPDGEHFISTTADEATNRGPLQGRIRIVVNWQEELKQRVPTR